MTKDIQKAIGKSLILKNYTAVCENIDVFHRWEYDVAALTKSGLLYEYEVKISRSDFLADRKKRDKFKYYSEPAKFYKHVPNYFIYAVPDGLVNIDELPEYAGLVYFKEDVLTEIKKAKRIHKNKPASALIKERMLRIIVQRTYLGCTLLTHKNKESRIKYDKWLEEQTPEYREYLKSL